VKRQVKLVGAISGSVALIATWVAPRSAFPLSGDADGAFANCGVAAFRVSGVTNELHTVAVQADNKVVAAGRGTVVRLTPTGALDPSFGVGGVVLLGLDIVVRGLALQSDGKVVVSGGQVLVRLDAGGTPDGSFGADGVVLAPNLSDGPVLVTPGGRIITTASGAIAAYTSSGQLDATFAAAGSQSVAGMQPFASLLAPNDDIVVAGAIGNDLAVVRVNANGDLDSGFDGDGILVDSVGSSASAHGVARQADGKLVTAGHVVTADGDQQVLLTRYSSDGTPDPSFGAGGRVIHGFTDGDTIVGLALQADGKLVTGGRALFAGDADAFLTRFHADGSIDAGFGLGGATYLDYGAAVGVNGLALLPDGRPLLVGRFGVGARVSMAVWRFQPDASTASYPATGYVLDGFGGLHPFASGCAGAPPVPVGNPAWPGWDIARDVAGMPAGEGLVLDGFGGLHGFKTYDPGLPKPTTQGAPAWPGWDIARGLAVMPDGSGGFVLDGYGGLHRFGIRNRARPAVARGGPKWPGWDIARDVVLYPDGTGGYVLDGYGGLHPFAIGFHPFPPAATGAPSWVGLDIARSVVLLPDGSGGYVLDGNGGLHPFGLGGHAPPPPASGGPSWPGWDIARGVGILP
jgi:uncharacterized delta-60 repeat protein